MSEDEELKSAKARIARMINCSIQAEVQIEHLRELLKYLWRKTESGGHVPGCGVYGAISHKCNCRAEEIKLAIGEVADE